jgi:2-dehydro-3-deoxyphosphogluconate aldolase/(4S)-4-hydroxy-2-oxoglutarate aldolase
VTTGSVDQAGWAELKGRLRAARVIPVIELPAAEHAIPLAQALVDGGLTCVEITFRTEAAAAGLQAIGQRFPELLLGAGTVLSTDQLDAALDGGADFIVSPGCSPTLVDACLERGVPIVPGVCTPTEIELARARGLDLVKFFPAEAMGGVRMLRALAGPYRQMEFVPTGGVAPSNLRDYLALPQVVACGGSWMVKPELLTEGRFDRVRELASEATELAREEP